MKLVALNDIDEEALRAVAPGLEFVRARRDAVLEAVRGADILIGHPGRAWPEILRIATRLRWVHVSMAGVDRLVCPDFIASPVILTCGKGEVAGPVLAEHAFALILALSRGIVTCARATTWEGGRPLDARSVYELGGKTLGLVGYGGAGRCLARLGRAFGMEVLALRRRAMEPTGDEGVALWGPDRFFELLERSDILVVTVPDTPETRGLFNAEAFRRMRPKALFITVGRGATFDTDALVEALRSGRIGGAGLDVVNPEPLPEDHPLRTFPNVLLTPHIAGESPERSGRDQVLVVENLRRFQRGEPLANQVDKRGGY